MKKDRSRIDVLKPGHMGAEVSIPGIFNTGRVMFGWALIFDVTRDKSCD